MVLFFSRFSLEWLNKGMCFYSIHVYFDWVVGVFWGNLQSFWLVNLALIDLDFGKFCESLCAQELK